MIKSLVKSFLARRNLALVSATWRDSITETMHSDLRRDQSFMELYERCQPFTMTSIERMYGLYQAVRYIVHHQIPGDLIECGVWRGGSTMLCALTLLQLHDTTRTIHLYDTFEGMTPPQAQDVDFRGQSADDVLEKLDPTGDQSGIAPLDEVRATMKQTGYPEDKLIYQKGRVEDTIPQSAPPTLALLRLDTDWYESTRHELQHLFPRLSPGGILILDDYGHWQGARQATDEYMAAHNLRLLPHRLDYTGRMWIK